MARNVVEWRRLALDAAEILQALTYARSEHHRQIALEKARKFLKDSDLINTEL